MKKIATSLITIYQVTLTYLLKNLLGVNKFCRYSPTCSEYTKMKIEEKGILKGISLGVIRISRCNPFCKNV